MLITITTKIKAPAEFVFNSYLNPNDNLRWNTAGGGWTTSFASVNPVAGGEFHIGFKSPDEKNDFDFGGVYTEIVENKSIKSKLDDGRSVEVLFENSNDITVVTINFEAEDENSADLQKQGWGQILANFKDFVERKANPNNTSISKSVQIAASKQTVWQELLEDESYRKWTAAFTEGSYYQGEMKYQGKIKFLSPDGRGISSEIVVFIPGYQISFQHLAVVINGQEDFETGEIGSWKGARETYTLTEKDGVTQLDIYVEVSKSEQQMMSGMWDKALEILKKLCEENR